YHAVFLYSLGQGKSYQLTDGMSDTLHLAFDRQSNDLYFTASTDIALSADWNDMSGIEHPVTRSVYVASFKDAPASLPIAPLAIPPRNYDGLIAGNSGVLFLIAGPPLEPLPGGARAASVTMFDRKASDTRTLLVDVDSWSRGLRYESTVRLSFDGKT